MCCRVGTIPLLISAFLLFASAVLADGECDKGFRDTTPAERATMTANLEAARQALPPPPEGWAGEDGKISPVLSICRDYEAGPWHYGFTRRYARTTGFEKQDSLIAVAAAVSKAELDAKQPRLDAITVRLTELGLQWGEAARKGDMARVDVISKEVDELNEEYAKLLDEGEAGAAVEAAEAAIRDTELSVTVDFSVAEMWHDPTATVLDVPGAAAAYRWGEGREGQALILIGDWHRGEENQDVCRPRSGARAEAAQSVLVKVRADEMRLESVVRTVDVKALAGLLPE